MAYNTIMFKHPVLGNVKAAPVGFSWTVLFFGFFPALFRSDWKWAVIMFLCALISGGLSGLVFMFIYNKLYIKDLIGKGYQATSIATGDIEFISAKLNHPIPTVAADRPERLQGK